MKGRKSIFISLILFITALVATAVIAKDYPSANWIAADTNNFQVANRTFGDTSIIVIHATGADNAQSTIDWFRDPTSEVSSHYLVDTDGSITQFVLEKDIAYHAKGFNSNSIGIEHVGLYQTNPVWATKKMYIESAKLVRYITQKYGLTRNRTTIVGHDDIDYPRKVDPGQYWNWDYYMQCVTDTNSPQIVVKDSQNNVIPDSGVTNSTNITIEVTDENGSGIDKVEVRKDNPTSGQLLFSDDTDYGQSHTYSPPNFPEGLIYVKAIDKCQNYTQHDLHMAFANFSDDSPILTFSKVERSSYV